MSFFSKAAWYVVPHAEIEFPLCVAVQKRLRVANDSLSRFNVQCSWGRRGDAGGPASINECPVGEKV
jgi:hypothetical protein